MKKALKIASTIRCDVLIIGAGGAGGFMVGEAGPGTIAGIRICAVVVGWITAGGANQEIRVCTDAGRALVISAIVAVIRAGRAIC